jgi:hypothetical protein
LRRPICAIYRRSVTAADVRDLPAKRLFVVLASRSPDLPAYQIAVNEDMGRGQRYDQGDGNRPCDPSQQHPERALIVPEPGSSTKHKRRRASRATE